MAALRVVLLSILVLLLARKRLKRIYYGWRLRRSFTRAVHRLGFEGKEEKIIIEDIFKILDGFLEKPSM